MSFTYDIRGFGRSKLPTLTPNKQHVWFWDILSQDHAQLFLAIKAKNYHKIQSGFCVVTV